MDLNFFMPSWKFKVKPFAFFYGITYKFWKILSGTLYEDFTTTVLTMKMHTESPLWSKKIIRKATMYNINLGKFYCILWGTEALENIDHAITQQGIWRRVSRAFSELVSNFIEA
jgi:hypothetical protein